MIAAKRRLPMRMLGTAMANQTVPVVLASASPARRQMLSAAGVACQIAPAHIDEEAVKSAMIAIDPHIDAAAIAARLAQEKARTVSQAKPGCLVIGADQVLVFENTIYSKAATAEEARAILKKLRGRTHELISAAALARDGALLWHGEDVARLTMRDFSDRFLGQYLNEAGSVIYQCVGCYELEKTGVQLFEKIEGDYFTVLGFPLLALLGALRTHAVLTS